MKQEDSMSGEPCSPSSHLSSSSTPSSHCSSRPASPNVPAHRPSNNIDFGRITDLETDLLPEDCLDASDFDQYLPPGAHSNQQLYHGQYLKHSSCLVDPESNNNINKNIRHYPNDALLSETETYNCEEMSSIVRYHELQPSNTLVKTERFPVPSTHSYAYQNSIGINPATTSYFNNTGQYLPSYQYMQHQRSVFGNAGSYTVNSVNSSSSNETWTNYVQ